MGTSGCFGHGVSRQPENPTGTDQPQGRILLWHGWEGASADALHEVLDNFRESHPQITVKVVAVDKQLLLDNYTTAASGGLGPDLLIGPDFAIEANQVRAWFTELWTDKLIADIKPQMLKLDQLRRSDALSLESAEAYLGIGEQLYGLPLSINSLALYYNRQRIENPATSLELLEAELNNGATIAMSSSFYDLFWGISAFGGELIDNQDQVSLNQGGFVNWLLWLKRANESGAILDNNRTDLRSQFGNGGVDYYIGGPQEYPAIAESLGASNVGVAPLPKGPLAPSVPFASVDAIYFNPSSSNHQQALALQLALFLTNQTQQTLLMRQAHRVPANDDVLPDPRLDSVVYSFQGNFESPVSLYQELSRPLVQAQPSAMVGTKSQLPSTNDIAKLLSYGNEAVSNVLNVDTNPIEAAADLTEQINSTLALTVVDDLENLGNDGLIFTETADPQIDCDRVGQLRLLHPDKPGLAIALNEIIGKLRAECPYVIVQRISTDLPLFSDVGAPLTSEAASLIRRADLVIAPHTVTGHLLENELIAPIVSTSNNELLQPLRENLYAQLKAGNTLYGLPLTVDLPMLYFNRDRLGNPALTITQLEEQMETANETATNLGFQTSYIDSFWGVAAFGGHLFGPSRGNELGSVGQLAETDLPFRLDGIRNEQRTTPADENTPNEGGIQEERDSSPLVEWLSWLGAHSETIIAHDDEQRLFDHFLNGELTYLVAGFDLMYEQNRRTQTKIESNIATGGDVRDAPTDAPTGIPSVLGVQQIGLVPLPSGLAAASPQPYLTVNTIFVSATGDYKQKTRSLAEFFAQYMTRVNAQSTLFDTAYQLPANNSVEVADDSIAKAFLDQNATALVLPAFVELENLTLLGDQIYVSVLQEGKSPQKAVEEAMQAQENATQITDGN